MVDIVTAFKIVKSSSELISFILQYLKAEADSLFADIPNIHYISAQQAFNAAQRSESKSIALTEIQIGIGHLRDSFNFIDEYCHKTTSFFVFFERKMNNGSKCSAVRQKLDIALLISLSYKKNNETENFQYWHTKCIDTLNEYEPLYLTMIKEWSVDYREETVPSAYASSGGGKSITRSFNENKYKDYKEQLADLKRRIRAIE